VAWDFLRVFVFVFLFESANEPAMRKDLTVPTFAESLFYTSYYTKYNTMFFCLGIVLGLEGLVVMGLG
jgi:hypothetical protein